MPTSAWLVGSTRLETANILVNGVVASVVGGDLYLRSANPVLSLLDRVQAALQSVVPTATIFLTQDRRVRLQPTAGAPVSIDWQSNLVLRDLLGYTGLLASSELPHDAPNVSPLLWSPGWPATPATRGGTAGRLVDDATRHVSADGRRVLVTVYYDQLHQDLAWSEIEADRLQVDDATDGGGTFAEFYRQVLRLGYSIRWYAEQNEVDGDTTAVTWDDSITNSFGPYVLRRTTPDWYRRVIDNVDLYGSLDLPLMQIAEYP